MQIELLGPLRVLADDGTEVAVPGTRLRRLLAELALRAGHPVSTGLLEDLLWTEEAPSGPGALQSLVSRLRRTLGDGATVAAGPAGYALRGVDVDVPQVEAGFARGRALLREGRSAQAEQTLTAALGRWRGPLAEIAGTPDAVRLEEARLEALADRARARLSLGELDGLAAELDELARAHPLREGFAELRVRVLTAAGRAGEALAAYEHTRKVLADELGADPSAPLRAAHLEALAGGPGPGSGRAGVAPAALTSFVGRDGDVARVRELLRSARCVTLVGPGGAGKTRLSTEVAALLGGVVNVVPLAPVAEGADVLGALAAVVGARDTGREKRPLRADLDQRSRVLSALGGPPTLLVLDNCEHVVDAVAHLAEDLLHACPGLTVLATSREGLGIEGEVLHPLGPLRGEAAVELFADRARAVSPGFSAEGAQRDVVERIVARLDGLPLALELAAARLRTMSPDDLLERLSDRFRVLTGGRRTAVARHRTLRAVVDWSWDLLEPDERTLLQRLSVFHAPVQVEAAAALAPDLGDEVTVADLLGSLVEKSLVQLRPGTPARYGVLETIREYGAERLAASGELEKALEARSDWALGVVERASAGLRGSAQASWSQRLDAESEDLLAALRHLVASARPADALRLAIPVATWWTALGRHAPAQEWLATARSGGPSGGPADLVAEGIELVNSVMDGRAQWEATRGRMEELRAGLLAVPAAERNAMTVLLSMFLERLTDEARGDVVHLADDPQVQRFLAVAPHDPWIDALVHLMCAAGAENLGDAEGMARYAALAAEGFGALGESWGRAGALRFRAQHLLYTGDLDGAERTYRLAADLVSAFGNVDDEVQLRMRLVDVLQRRGLLEEATAELDRMGVVAGTTSATTRTWLVLTQVGLLRATGRLDEAHAVVREQLADLSRRPTSAIWGHERAGLLTAWAHVQLATGRLEEAAATVRESVEFALGTFDMPIVSLAAVAAARWSLLAGEPARSARLLGVAANLRGADDRSEPDVARTRADLERHLAAEVVEAAHAAARDLPRSAALAALRAAVGLRDDERGTP
ncbi:ATP-binding protein [Kineococcus rhizosphaerae]|uniref:Putative ATPase n=1 Tax=Kineococcus rhizosphaerae TaxID=559628 RepID=A0A2T0QZ71_9ACTN|nr:BTAD domain-containing putative transcriptional regulator [Kineococcus rhizosphaerae]PRY11819.1 putative ATPase [Kineococcus rhizosphaerae]